MFFPNRLYSWQNEKLIWNGQVVIFWCTLVSHIGWLSVLNTVWIVSYHASKWEVLVLKADDLPCSCHPRWYILLCYLVFMLTIHFCVIMFLAFVKGMMIKNQLQQVQHQLPHQSSSGYNILQQLVHQSNTHKHQSRQGNQTVQEQMICRLKDWMSIKGLCLVLQNWRSSRIV